MPFINMRVESQFNIQKKLFYEQNQFILFQGNRCQKILSELNIIHQINQFK